MLKDNETIRKYTNSKPIRITLNIKGPKEIKGCIRALAKSYDVSVPKPFYLHISKSGHIERDKPL